MRARELSIKSGGRERPLGRVHAPLSRGRGHVLRRAGSGYLAKDGMSVSFGGAHSIRRGVSLWPVADLAALQLTTAAKVGMKVMEMALGGKDSSLAAPVHLGHCVPSVPSCWEAPLWFLHCCLEQGEEWTDPFFVQRSNTEKKDAQRLTR